MKWPKVRRKSRIRGAAATLQSCTCNLLRYTSVRFCFLPGRYAPLLHAGWHEYTQRQTVVFLVTLPPRAVDDVHGSRWILQSASVSRVPAARVSYSRSWWELFTVLNQQYSHILMAKSLLVPVWPEHIEQFTGFALSHLKQVCLTIYHVW